MTGFSRCQCEQQYPHWFCLSVWPKDLSDGKTQMNFLANPVQRLRWSSCPKMKPSVTCTRDIPRNSELKVTLLNYWRQPSSLMVGVRDAAGVNKHTSGSSGGSQIHQLSLNYSHLPSPVCCSNYTMSLQIIRNWLTHFETSYIVAYCFICADLTNLLHWKCVEDKNYILKFFCGED